MIYSQCGSEGPWFDGCKPHQVNLQKDNGASFTLWLVYMCQAQLTAISVCFHFSNFFYKCKQIQISSHVRHCIANTVFTRVSIHICTQVCLSADSVTVLSVCLNCMTCMAAHAFHVIVLAPHIYANACMSHTQTTDLDTVKCIHVLLLLCKC